MPPGATVEAPALCPSERTRRGPEAKLQRRDLDSPLGAEGSEPAARRASMLNGLFRRAAWCSAVSPSASQLGTSAPYSIICEMHSPERLSLGPCDAKMSAVRPQRSPASTSILAGPSTAS
eukprot:5634289-Prymnesium_polylepis.2